MVALLAGGGMGVAALAGGGDEARSSTTTTIMITGTTNHDPHATTTPPNAPPTSLATAPGAGPAYVAVKVDNAPDARPQVGIGKAPLVFEVPVEGGLTRFTAYFASADAAGLMVGPVRSLRPVDADLISAFATTVVSSGGQPFVLQAVDAAGLVRADGEFAPGFTLVERPSPYNLFVRLEEVFAVLNPVGPDAPGFSAGEWSGGAEAAVVTIPFATPATWEFGDGVYTRIEGGIPVEIQDQPDGELVPLSFVNIVLLFAAERFAGYTDSVGAEVPDFDVIGTGRMLAFHNGQVVEGSWLRGAQEDPYSLFDVEGRSFGIPVGRTYAAVIPRPSVVDY